MLEALNETPLPQYCFEEVEYQQENVWDNLANSGTTMAISISHIRHRENLLKGQVGSVCIVQLMELLIINETEALMDL